MRLDCESYLKTDVVCATYKHNSLWYAKLLFVLIINTKITGFNFFERYKEYKQ